MYYSGPSTDTFFYTRETGFLTVEYPIWPLKTGEHFLYFFRTLPFSRFYFFRTFLLSRFYFFRTFLLSRFYFFRTFLLSRFYFFRTFLLSTDRGKKYFHSNSIQFYKYSLKEYSKNNMLKIGSFHSIFFVYRFKMRMIRK